MRILIWGAGGIGCYYGARLQTAGHQVVYVGRGAHLRAMQDIGLQVEHEGFSFQQPVVAVEQQALLRDYRCEDFDLIVLTLKCAATEALLSEAQAWLKRGSCAVLSLQNGVENEPQIAATVGNDRTLGGLAVRIGGHILEPGRVEAKGVAQVVLGNWPRQQNDSGDNFVDQLKSVFDRAGIPTTVSDDIERELWRKLLINNGVNPLSALTGLDTRQLTSHSAYGPVVYKMMEETKEAANQQGVALQQSDVDEMFKLISEFDAIKTSMLVDQEKGRKLELDGISGAVIRRCQLSKRPALFTEMIVALLNK